ncbi:MAG: type IV pilus modification protein PilV [Pseudomonadota bacterium]
MRHRARGFTLVEALIALAVLSLGLLGAAAMLLDSLRSQGQSLRLVAATHLLRDMAERINANPTAAARYATARAEMSASPCDAAGCDAPQLAAADLAHFAERALATLPGDSLAVIEYAPATGSVEPGHLVISLRWQDPRFADAETVSLQVPTPPVAG